MLIKYRNHKPFPIYKHIFALYVSQNVTAHAQSTSTTHFSYSSKCRRTSLYKTYHRVFDSLNQKARVRAITFAPPYITFVFCTTPPTTLCQYNIVLKIIIQKQILKVAFKLLSHASQCNATLKRAQSHTTIYHIHQFIFTWS